MFFFTLCGYYGRDLLIGEGRGGVLKDTLYCIRLLISAEHQPCVLGSGGHGFSVVWSVNDNGLNLSVYTYVWACIVCGALCVCVCVCVMCCDVM